MENQEQQHKRRVRYKGTHPRSYKEKYKELQPEKYADTIEKVIQKGGTPAGMHISICVQEILDFLQIQPGQTGLDATLGYGGHSSKMLSCLEGKGHLYALDVDPIEIKKTKARLEKMGYGEDILTIKQMNFADVEQLKEESGGFDFVLADLGVSSMQIDNPERGFTYKFEGPLDLRLNPEKGISAADIFYFSGVTPAISDNIEIALIEALKYCKEHNIQVVCDLNYRGKMWSTEKAQSVMKQLMNYVDLCIANDEDFESSLGIHAFDGDLSHGINQIDDYKRGMLEITKQYPNCKAVASVLRNIHTVEDGQWMGIYLCDGKFYESPIHTVHSLEAVGAGDAFAAGLLHALVKGFSPQKLIDFSIAASIMKLMIQHDFNVVSEEEIFKIMKSKEVNLSR